MNRMLQKLLLLYIFFSSKIEIIFGLSKFNSNRWQRVLTLFSFVIRALFLILYPLVCLRVLNFSKTFDKSVTKYARNLTFIFNWLLLVCIYANETINANFHRKSFNMKRMFIKLIEVQSTYRNLLLLFRCTIKFLLIFVMLFYNSLTKYLTNTSARVPPWEKMFSMFILMLPFFVFSLATNRIYVANTVVKLFLERNDLESLTSEQEMKTEIRSINYKHVHELFNNFNRSNAINLIGIICFCILNIVYEVKKFRFSCYKCFQAYFLYLHITSSIENLHRPSTLVVRKCLSFIALYYIEMFLTIQVFEDIKKSSSERNVFSSPEQSQEALSVNF